MAVGSAVEGSAPPAIDARGRPVGPAPGLRRRRPRARFGQRRRAGRESDVGPRRRRRCRRLLVGPWQPA
eukprot:13250996-Alexandrium_andersonii.AAC.1